MQLINKNLIPLSLLFGAITLGLFYYQTEKTKQDFALKQIEIQFLNNQKLEEEKLKNQIDLQEQQKEEKRPKEEQSNVVALQKKAEASKCFSDKMEEVGIENNLENLSKDFIPFCLSLETLSYQDCVKKQKEGLDNIESFIIGMKKICGVQN